MRYLRFGLLLAASAIPALGQAVLHDKASSCQITLPAGWTALSDTPWIGHAPGNAGNVEVVSQAGKTVKPLNEAAQKALLIDKVFSNTTQSIFYSNEAPKTADPLISYRAVAPGKGGICVALIAARTSIKEDVLKKMVATLSVK